MTHYDTLGVVPTASAAEIRDAYRRLARRHHPDRAAERDATAMAAINEAYRVLGDAGRRAAYDAQLRGGGVRTVTSVPGPWAAVIIHSTGDTAAAMARCFRNRIRQWHPEVMMEFEDFQTRIRDGLVRERLLAMLAGFFGVVAAVLAMVGLYGMISFSVARRQREIGIRAALGARRPQVVGMVMREAGALTSVGLLIGLVSGAAASWLAGQNAATLLFGIRTTRSRYGAWRLPAADDDHGDCQLHPARRASRFDPQTALRRELSLSLGPD